MSIDNKETAKGNSPCLKTKTSTPRSPKSSVRRETSISLGCWFSRSSLRTRFSRPKTPPCFLGLGSSPSFCGDSPTAPSRRITRLSLISCWFSLLRKCFTRRTGFTGSLPRAAPFPLSSQNLPLRQHFIPFMARAILLLECFFFGWRFEVCEIRKTSRQCQPDTAP